jgi:hypothetical protein
MEKEAVPVSVPTISLEPEQLKYQMNSKKKFSYVSGLELATANEELR